MFELIHVYMVNQYIYTNIRTAFIVSTNIFYEVYAPIDTIVKVGHMDENILNLHDRILKL